MITYVQLVAPSLPTILVLSLLPPATEGYGNVMFSLCQFTGGGGYLVSSPRSFMWGGTTVSGPRSLLGGPRRIGVPPPGQDRGTPHVRIGCSPLIGYAVGGSPLAVPLRRCFLLIGDTFVLYQMYTNQLHLSPKLKTAHKRTIHYFQISKPLRNKLVLFERMNILKRMKVLK